MTIEEHAAYAQLVEHFARIYSVYDAGARAARDAGDHQREKLFTSRKEVENSEREERRCHDLATNVLKEATDAGVRADHIERMAAVMHDEREALAGQIRGALPQPRRTMDYVYGGD